MSPSCSFVSVAIAIVCCSMCPNGCGSVADRLALLVPKELLLKVVDERWVDAALACAVDGLLGFAHVGALEGGRDVDGRGRGLHLVALVGGVQALELALPLALGFESGRDL